MALKKAVTVSLAVFLSVVLSGVWVTHAVFDMVRYGDKPELLPQPLLPFVTGLAVSIVVAIILWRLLALLTRTIPGYVIPIALGLNICLQVAVIYFFRINLTADWQLVYSIAEQFLRNEFAALTKGVGHLYGNPHNIGITLYFVVMNLIAPGNLYIPRLLNVAYATGTSIILYRLFPYIFPGLRHHAVRFFLVCLLFLPVIFMSNHIYNEVPSTFLFVLGVYLAVRVGKRLTAGRIIVIAAVFALGNFMRSLGAIFVIATALYFLYLRLDVRKIFLFVMCAWVGFQLPLWVFNMTMVGTHRITEPIGRNTIPITKWLNTGISEEYFGYWDQGQGDRIYAQEADWDRQKADTIYRQMMWDKLLGYGWQPLTLMYYKKLVWLWSEGTYQSVYLGMSYDRPGGYIEPTPVSAYFNNDLSRRDWFTVPMYFSNILILGAIALYAWQTVIRRQWQRVGADLYPMLIVLGFAGFYLLWEIKPRYIYSVYPYLLLLAYGGIAVVFPEQGRRRISSAGRDGRQRPVQERDVRSAPEEKQYRH